MKKERKVTDKQEFKEQKLMFQLYDNTLKSLSEMDKFLEKLSNQTKKEILNFNSPI